MVMQTLKFIQIISSVILIALVLLQSKDTGLIGGVGKSFTFYRSKRGVEKAVFILTIIFGIVLIINSILIITSA